MKLDKTEIKSLITGYIDGELNEVDVKKVKELLENSKEFKNLYEAEMEIKGLVTQRVQKGKAPVELKRRIKRQISRQNGRPGFAQLVSELFEFRPMTSSFAMAAIAILILLPNLSKLSSPNAVEFMQISGEVVCLDCNILSKHIDVPEHTDQVHRPGIRGDDGSIWTIIQNSQGLNVDMSFLRKKIQISGLAFNELRYIKVEEYHLL